MTGRGTEERTTVQIWPSILAADLADLAQAVRRVPHADGLHVDMMDGHFVPNLTMGPPVLAALARHTSLPLEAHLMVTRAEDWLDDLAQAGARRVTVHVEASIHLERTLTRIRELGMEAWAALNPATPPQTLEWVLGDLDGVLVMTVNPGFGGQRLISAALDKIQAVAALREAHGAQGLRISVDGGMDMRTAPEAVRRGAQDIVAGSAVYGQDDPDAAVRALRAACEAVAGVART